MTIKSQTIGLLKSREESSLEMIEITIRDKKETTIITTRKEITIEEAEQTSTVITLMGR